MNKYLFLTSLSIVSIVTFIEPSHSSSPCYLIDANGNQVNLGFVCDVVRTTTTTTPATATTVTTPPTTTVITPPTTTVITPLVSPTQGNTASPELVGDVITIPQETKTQPRPSRRILRILNNRNDSNNTNP